MGRKPGIRGHVRRGGHDIPEHIRGTDIKM
jgi:hypothetical protein